MSRTIAPGESTRFTLSTIAPGFVDLLVSRVDASGVSLRLSCALTSGLRINCIGLG
ncbi:MAG TPA: hypothetical protein VK919_07340 [Solirubrobacterales bacterium]|nr:hypothetical protein [Solirubrobacterales bacterium]